MCIARGISEPRHSCAKERRSGVQRFAEPVLPRQLSAKDKTSLNFQAPRQCLPAPAKRKPSLAKLVPCTEGEPSRYDTCIVYVYRYIRMCKICDKCMHIYMCMYKRRMPICLSNSICMHIHHITSQHIILHTCMRSYVCRYMYTYMYVYICQLTYTAYVHSIHVLHLYIALPFHLVFYSAAAHGITPSRSLSSLSKST